MNSSLRSLRPRSQAYLDAVRRQLADLPAADQDDLAGQVEQRLRDLDASTEPGSPEARLGPAAQMAVDLRAAAGFGPAPAREAPQPRVSTLDLLRSAAASPAVRPVLAYAVSLRPAWWIVRGYMLVAGVLAIISQGSGYGLHILGSYRDAYATSSASHFSPAWLLIPAAAVLASIALGTVTGRLPAPARLVVTVLNLAAVAVIVAYPTWWLAPAFASYSGLLNF